MTIIASWLTLNKKRITYLVFGVLFVARAISGYLLAIYHGKLPQTYFVFLLTTSLVFLTVFILANKEELDQFNIDRYVIYTFVLSGAALFLSFELSLPWITSIVCSLAIGTALFKSKLKLSQQHILLFIVIGIIPELFFKLVFSNIYQGYKFFAGLSIGSIITIISITLWGVIFEELLFRSILWRILNDWKFSNKKIILTQAFLFWLVHLDFITSKSFGLHIFVFGIWVGYLTLRSKSLTPSIATHFFHNITSRLF